MSDTTQQMAEEMYKRMSDYVGANHEENCVNFIKFALDSMETKLEEKEREVEVNEKAYLWEKEQKDLLKAENKRLRDTLELAHEHMELYLPHYRSGNSVCSEVEASLQKEEEDV